MKTIIAGSRDICDYDVLLEVISKCPWEITEVISGTARGVDRLGERWAKENNITCTKYPANWNMYGKSAGRIRNAKMASVADATIAIWDDKSNGTRNMIELSKIHELGLIVHIVNKDDNNIDHLFE